MPLLPSRVIFLRGLSAAVETSSHTDTEWDLDYDFQLSRINASTLLVNYNFGAFTVGGGDAFLQIPQPHSTAIPEGQCSPVRPLTTTSVPAVSRRPGLWAVNKRGSAPPVVLASTPKLRQLQFATAQTAYNWDCCGATVEYRRYAIANVRNENLFRFTFTLANIGAFGNLRRQDRLY